VGRASREMHWITLFLTHCLLLTLTHIKAYTQELAQISLRLVCWSKSGTSFSRNALDLFISHTLSLAHTNTCKSIHAYSHTHTHTHTLDNEHIQDAHQARHHRRRPESVPPSSSPSSTMWMKQKQEQQAQQQHRRIQQVLLAQEPHQSCYL